MCMYFSFIKFYSLFLSNVLNLVYFAYLVVGFVGCFLVLLN